MLSKMNKNEWGLLLGLLFMWGCDSESAGKGYYRIADR